MVANISRRSESDFGRYRNSLSAYILLIIRSGKKLIYFRWLRELHLNQPGCAVRVGIESLGRGAESFIDRDYFA